MKRSMHCLMMKSMHAGAGFEVYRLIEPHRSTISKKYPENNKNIPLFSVIKDMI